MIRAFTVSCKNGYLLVVFSQLRNVSIAIPGEVRKNDRLRGAAIVDIDVPIGGYAEGSVTFANPDVKQSVFLDKVKHSIPVHIGIDNLIGVANAGVLRCCAEAAAVSKRNIKNAARIDREVVVAVVVDIGDLYSRGVEKEKW